MFPPTHFAFPAAIDFAARHRAPEAAKALTPEARQRLAEADSEAWRLRLEGALRGLPPDTPITLPPDKALPGFLLAAQQAFREEVEAVTRDLRQALEAGALRAMGFRDGMPVPVPAAYWRTPVRWCEAAGATVEADPFERAAKGDLVPMDGAFIAPALDRGDVARWCGALPPAPPPPTYSVEALRAWYRLRAATWPPGDIPPTERDDIDAARAHFRRDVSREVVRRCRETLAPASWRRPGPRRRRKPRE
jgi:hypothetical protein